VSTQVGILGGGNAGIPFHRLSFPKAFSEHCVPAGGSAMMAESTCDEGDALWSLDDAWRSGPAP
jgi:hypothetical protein